MNLDLATSISGIYTPVPGSTPLEVLVQHKLVLAQRHKSLLIKILAKHRKSMFIFS